MSELVRCYSCKGTKRILGMGGMVKPCGVCNAVGWITIENENPVIVEGLKNSNGNPVKARKKPGPKKRIQTDILEV